MLEECGIEYKIIPVNIGKGEQFKSEFLRISPNNRMPAIVDHDVEGKPVSIFESGAILQYLAEKTGKFMPTDLQGRLEVLQWLYWQTGGLGPMAGQLSHFVNYAEGDHPYSQTRYANEYNRLLGVLDRRLAGRDFITGQYSIADMASFPWVLPHTRFGQTLEEFPNLNRWYESLKARPKTSAGVAVGEEYRRSSPPTEEARKILFGQTARSTRI